MADLRRLRDEAAAQADLVELRLDAVARPDAAGALEGRTRPVIVTCRAAWEGGHFGGSEEERERVLRDALSLGAEYVDCEWKAGFDALVHVDTGRRIVLSSHTFDETPGDLDARVRAMRATGAEVVKIAAQARSLRDCLAMFSVGGRHGAHGAGVFISMGEYGLPSRVLASRFGSAWTYAGSVAGVGQLSPKTLIDLYRFRSIGPDTAIYGVVGSPIAHSVSPAMHNAAFAAEGLDAVYVPLRATDADDFLAFARGLRLRGASVTIPFKVALLERMDMVTDAGRHAGAINTVRVDERGSFHGDNTDAAGFLRPLQERQVVLRGARVSVLGAGGSARAVVASCAALGATVTVHARQRDKAEAVATPFGAHAGSWPPAAGSWDLLVNCTPVGMHPAVDATPIAGELLTGRLVYDLVYNPPETRLLREAAAAGCDVLNGLEMLVAQAQAQFEWWTGRRPDRAVMRAAAERRLAELIADEHHHV